MKRVSYWTLSPKGREIVDEFKRLSEQQQRAEREKKEREKEERERKEREMRERERLAHERKERERFEREKRERERRERERFEHEKRLDARWGSPQGSSTRYDHFSTHFSSGYEPHYPYSPTDMMGDEARKAYESVMNRADSKNSSSTSFGGFGNFPEAEIQRLLNGAHHLTWNIDKEILKGYQNIANDQLVDESFEEPAEFNRYRNHEFLAQTSGPHRPFGNNQERIEQAEALASRFRAQNKQANEEKLILGNMFVDLKMPEEALRAPDKSPYYGQALRRAAKIGNDHFCELLLKQRAPIDEIDNNPAKKMTALHYALGSQHIDLAVKFIIEKNARVDIENANGRTALDYIVRLPGGDSKTTLLDAVKEKHPLIYSQRFESPEKITLTL